MSGSTTEADGTSNSSCIRIFIIVNMRSVTCYHNIDDYTTARALEFGK